MIGKTISHYKILEKLGEGGMGVVYKAEDTRLLRQVAIKILIPELATNTAHRQPFIKEAQTASALNHPGICTIHDIGQVDKANFIVMEFVEGETLRQVLTRRGPLSEAEVIDIAITVCNALAAVHDKGILHRDIKPENIMISRQGFLKVMDFGLARLAIETAENVAELKLPKSVKRRLKKQEQNYTDSVVLTNLSGFLGTVAYMSPEQATGKDIDHRTDIWSIGVTLYEMLTGEQPFKGELDQAVIYSILNEEPQPLVISRPGVQIDFEKIINKCLQKDPSDRYQQVRELIVDLRKVKKERSSARSYEVKTAAYSNFMKGVHCFENFTPMNLQKSLEYFELAVGEEPDFMEAHIGLAQTLVHTAMTAWRPPGETFPSARALIHKALKIQPENAEAYALLGLITFLEYNWSEAETTFKQAFTYNSESILAKDAYAFYLTAFLRHEESISHVRDCLATAPNACYYHTRMGWTYCLAGRYDEALTILLKTHELFPELAFPHVLLAWCYTKKGMHADAMEQCTLSESKGLPKWQNAFSYCKAGRVDEIKDAIKVIHEQNLSTHFWFVDLYLSLGEIDLAIEQMYKVYEMKESPLVFIKALPHFDDIRTDPRYLDIVKKMGLAK